MESTSRPSLSARPGGYQDTEITPVIKQNKHTSNSLYQNVLQQPTLWRHTCWVPAALPLIDISFLLGQQKQNHHVLRLQCKMQ